MALLFRMTYGDPPKRVSSLSLEAVRLMKPLALIVVWFGKWPDWINLYLASCRWNPEVEWLVVTDQEPPDNRPEVAES